MNWSRLPVFVILFYLGRFFAGEPIVMVGQRASAEVDIRRLLYNGGLGLVKVDVRAVGFYNLLCLGVVLL